MSVRKMAHYLLFALGGGIVFCVLNCFCIKHKMLIAIFLGMLLACADEFHQFYSSNRGPQMTDVVLDSFGVVSGVLLTAFCIKGIEQLKKGEKIYD